MAGREWEGRKNCQLSHAGLDLFASALLGRADPDCAVPALWRGTSAGSRLAGAPAARRAVSAYGHGGIPTGGDPGVGPGGLPALWHAGPARNRYHAAMGRVLLVFFTLCLTALQHGLSRS